MTDFDEFEEERSEANDGRGQERRAQALMKKQILDDSSVAAFAQLGASFFAAARARLAGPREDAEPTPEAIRARHERLVRNARWRPSTEPVEEALKEEQTTLAAPSPHDDFANAARARLLLKRKREGEAGEAPEKPSHLKKTTLSFAGSADDDF
ncbi:Uncharacterized protein SCF082_LOCUS38656 [Durusdinium trenchii]|uniref:Uncharacterized protein n=1 Tax=Durusdinium trenchii TaxID=1381693 RepID=A0ABP0Q1H3_9DINO